jgi:phage shock protein A
MIGDINGMKKQLNDLEVRIENLNKMLASAIRYGEEDLQRMIRYKIEGLEREMKILKNKMS